MKPVKKILKAFYFKHIIISVLISNLFLNVPFFSFLQAGPEGAQVINGQVSFQQSGNNTTITASDQAIINYSSFDIAQPEIVNFIQPNSNASVLNRINSAGPTRIDGTLSANGRVFFITLGQVQGGTVLGDTFVPALQLKLKSVCLDSCELDFLFLCLKFVLQGAQLVFLENNPSSTS